MYAIVGLGYGDEGKGTIVESLARRVNAKTIGRYSGGAQALHHVVLPNGTWHGFSQFTSGTFQRRKTYLGPGVIVAPDSMLLEAKLLSLKHVRDPLDLVTVHPEAIIATPWHRWVNKFRETSRGDSGRHGSCGMGIGEAAKDKENKIFVKAGDCSEQRLLKDLKFVHYKLSKRANGLGFKMPGPTVEEVAATYQRWAEKVKIDLVWPDLLESSQGTLISSDVAISKHKTKLPVSANEARRQYDNLKVVGVIRAFMTRHGRGHFKTEIFNDYHRNRLIFGEHNEWNQWQEDFRVGHLDIPALKYAIRKGGQIDYLAITCLDRVKFPLRMCERYPTKVNLEPTYIRAKNEDDLITILQDLLGVPVMILSRGPTYQDKEYLIRP
jgi:adenylosuccinate synthase